MASIRHKSAAKAAPKAASKAPTKSSMLMAGKPAGKGKPVAKKPADKAAKVAIKPAAKPAGKTVVKPVAKVTVKPAAKPAAKPVAPAKAANTAKPAAKGAAPANAKPGAKPAGKGAPAKPPVLNAGAAKAKALAEARAAAAAAEAERKRIPKLVPATPGAIRPGAAKVVPTKGKSSPKPPAEVRPIGVLPPESMMKPKSSAPAGRIVIPARVDPSTTNAARLAAQESEKLSKADLDYFEQRLLKERARIAGEMGHLESSILKVSPRDSGGQTGDYTFNMADAGTDSMEREISFDIASKEGRLLREIDDALRRIYNGVYGICESSGKMIARARLEALPWARYTVQEQENIERQQRAGRLAKEEE